MSEPDATQVVAGHGTLYVAPLGTTLPTLDSTPGEYPVVWPAGWVQVGYTDDGIDMVYTPTVKDITVDEEMSPVAKLLTEEKMSIEAKLAEATLANLNRAISASTYTDDSAGAGKAQVFKAGSGVINYVMVGVQGPAPGTNLARVIIVYKAVATAAVQMKMQRKDKVVIPVKFEGVADSTKPAGQRLFEIVDIAQGAS